VSRNRLLKLLRLKELTDEEKAEAKSRLESEFKDQILEELKSSLRDEVANQLKQELKDEMQNEVLVALEEETRSKIEVELSEQKNQLEQERKVLLDEQTKIQEEQNKLQSERQLLETDKLKVEADLDQLQIETQKLTQETQNAEIASSFVVDNSSSDQIKELQVENANFREIIQELESELESERNTVIAERERTQSSDKLEQKFTDEKAELIKKHEQLVSGMENSLTKVEKLNAEKSDEIKLLHEEINSLKAEVQLVKQSEASSTTPNTENVSFKQEYEDLKKDQDDLLELLSDQQVKLGEYRERLKENNLPVTDDDDLEDL